MWEWLENLLNGICAAQNGELREQVVRLEAEVEALEDIVRLLNERYDRDVNRLKEQIRQLERMREEKEADLMRQMHDAYHYRK